MADRLDRRRATIAAGLCVAVLLLVAATQLLPWLTQQREVVSSTPVRAELSVVQPIALAAGQRACLDNVTLDPSTQIAALTILRPAPSGARLTLETAGSGYRASSVTRVGPGAVGRIEIPFSPPRQGVLGTLCVRNAARATIQLAGTANPRALTRSTMSIDGTPRPEAFSLTLLEAGTRSYLARVPQLVDHAAALGAAGRWLLWLLLVLVAVGVPAAVVAALWLALREPEPRASAPGGVSDRPTRE